MQIRSPGIYVFHVFTFFRAMVSPCMMIGSRDLSPLIHHKSMSPAGGNFVGVEATAEIGCPLLSRHFLKSVL